MDVLQLIESLHNSLGINTPRVSIPSDCANHWEDLEEKVWCWACLWEQNYGRAVS